MHVKRILFVMLAILQLAYAYALTERARIAVVPFNYVNVSKADAAVITEFFETALVKTGSFAVIEQTQISMILDAQEYSVSECTDEQCAIQFGKLLSAEQIVLGTVSVLGGKYFINTKIIDVATGKNIKADNVSTDSIDKMAQATELLAYKLAGLTYMSGGDVKIAKEFGEIFIDTDPEGADIYINGAQKGVSPTLVSHIPIGKIRIECRKDAYYGMKEDEITENSKKIKITLAVTYGNFFIASSEKSVQVYLDGKLLGDLGTGFFEKVLVGTHKLELKGNWIFWAQDISVGSTESAKIEATPRAYGILEYRLPEGIAAELEGKEYREVVRGQGKVSPLFVGDYLVTARGTDFKEYKEKIKVEKGKTLRFEPKMEYSEEYKAGAENAEKNKQHKEYSEKLAGFEKLIAKGYRVTQKEIDELSLFCKKLKDIKYVFSDLIDKGEGLLDSARKRQAKYDELDTWYAKKNMIVTRINLVVGPPGQLVGGWTGIGAGAALLGFAGVSFLLGGSAYDKYLGATNVNDVTTFKDEFRTWDTMAIVGLCLGVGGGALGVILLTTTPPEDKEKKTADVNTLNEELSRVNAVIDTLEGELNG